MKTFKYYIQLMRWDKPIGTLLLLWPTLAALWLASYGIPSWDLIIIFTLGVFVMRSAGCVINDIADQHFDKNVMRTRERPLAAGKIPVTHAWVIFFSLISMALLLVCQLNFITFMLAPWILLLVMLYPFSKRYTYWPQAVLGLTFYSSILMAFTAVQQHIPLTAIIFYISAALWAIAYDTEYAMVDRDDDKKIAIKSTALLFGHYDRLMIAILQTMVLLLWVVMGFIAHLSTLYFLALIIISAFMLYQHVLLRKQQYFKAFSNNHWIGLILFIAIVA